jgi:hypothetical protein
MPQYIWKIVFDTGLVLYRSTEEQAYEEILLRMPKCKVVSLTQFIEHKDYEITHSN